MSQTSPTKEGDNKRRRVLSIQSHVVYGYVGNKAATFPLQLHGFHVDGINAVHFSNHTGYPSVKGTRADPNHLNDLFLGLEGNGLLGDYTHLLTGYIGRAECLMVLSSWIQRWRSGDFGPECRPFFLCDPVMGDQGKMYVPTQVLPVYRDVLIPMADCITPNAFEAELLTGISIRSIEDAQRALSALHALGVPHVVITSVELTSSESNMLTLIGSSFTGSQEEGPNGFRIDFPKFPGQFTGTGDCFSALLLAFLEDGKSTSSSTLTHGALARACERAVSVVMSVIERTSTALPLPDGSTIPPKQRELHILECRDIIMRGSNEAFAFSPRRLCE